MSNPQNNKKPGYFTQIIVAGITSVIISIGGLVWNAVGLKWQIEGKLNNSAEKAWQKIEKKIGDKATHVLKEKIVKPLGTELKKEVMKIIKAEVGNQVRGSIDEIRKALMEDVREQVTKEVMKEIKPLIEKAKTNMNGEAKETLKKKFSHKFFKKKKTSDNEEEK